MLDNEMEILNPDLPRGRFRSVLFDFDGTLSLIREGWPQIMIPMMVEVLRGTGTSETDSQLTAAVEEFVMRLNGRQTIYQMMQLADEVRKRGGQPREPLAYKHRYHDLLMQRIDSRLTRQRIVTPKRLRQPDRLLRTEPIEPARRIKVRIGQSIIDRR